MGSCKQSPSKPNQINIEVNNRADSIKIKDFKLYDTSIRKDSLEINASSTFIFFPFGEYTDVSSFATNYKNLKLEIFSSPVYGDTSYIINLYRFSSEYSYVTFCLERVSDVPEDTTERMGVVFAKIIDNQIFLDHNIKIGMTREEFLKRFTDNIEMLNPMSPINVYELMADGIWHYYTFKNDTLVSIILDTDRQLNKD